MLLNLHSSYSLRYGTLSIDQLVKKMVDNGYDTGVLTDINNSSACLSFIKECQAAGLKGLVGMEYRNANKLLYIGIAKNREGFKELNEQMTLANKEKSDLPERAPEWNHVFVVYPLGNVSVEALRENEFIGIRPNELNKVLLSSRKEKSRYVVLNPVSFCDGQHSLHQQLRAIHQNKLITQLDKSTVAQSNEHFIPYHHLINIYSCEPQIIRNTKKLLAQCDFDFDFNKSRNKKNFTDSRYEDTLLLRRYALEGCVKRYGANNKQAENRVLSELDMVDNLNFSSYFLITDDICRYARKRDFHYVGRGSGANSIIAYCLGITDVCPIELNLYFERFLNSKRRNPPDFDIDFSWRDRDEIYAYIFRRYQNQYTALMGATSAFKDRSIIRELGKIYGLPKDEIDLLVQNPEYRTNKSKITRRILEAYDQMTTLPNQRTIHASGILISEKPLTYYSALDYPPKGLLTVQYDMYAAEDIGFEKFDILSQRGIGHVKDCRELVYENQGIKVEKADPKVLFEDPKIAKQLKTAHTIGCFYIESPAMRQLLQKLKCADYPTLVAASSIIRPGVASSGMMQAFIERHLDPSKAEYIHPVFKEQLEETYGVMVYQEDVMKIGHHFGGLDLADADVLRRMMSGKYRNQNHLIEIEDKYFKNCKEKGYPNEATWTVWKQMESFAGYSFNKAHSASFAVESYQSLYLKTYYPLEFMVAVLNNYGGFYSREVYINEARKEGANIHLPDVNKSRFNASIQGKDLYLGFDCLLHLEESLAHRIPLERETNGNYKNLENFHLRTGAGLEQMVVLIRIGAFRFFNVNKKELLWEVHFLWNQKKNTHPRMHSLFETSEPKKPVLPYLKTDFLEHLYDELELIGFPVSGSLFDLAKSDYKGNVTAESLPHHEGKMVRIVAHLVAWKTARTKHKSFMKFGTFLDEKGDFIDTVHFSQSLNQYPLHGKGLYLIEGRCVMDFGCATIQVFRCALMPLKPDPRSV